ncbi:hypothetical protein ACIGXM_35905 [Kitasatospora sp. NPDC052896]|uniref:hypothetical protein n=1 Tax=Kitasatospora sp. NPDC052896 TaxID=3364061 RepID=UPI0037C6301C
MGEQLEVDTCPGRRWVLRGGANAAGALVRGSRLDQFAIPSGRSEVRWTALDYTGTSRLAITWRDTYNSL